MLERGFNIIIGGQAGSEGKGKLSAYLCHIWRVAAVCSSASPNSGHTAWINGKKCVTHHLPVGALAKENAQILLGPSSVIYIPVLLKELEEFPGVKDRLTIHPRASIITDADRDKEQELVNTIGSTGQGVGEARIKKIARIRDHIPAKDIPELKSYIGDTVEIVNSLVDGCVVLCEMTQGFDLCLEHGIDPSYCTSKIIHPSIAAAEAGVGPECIREVIGVIRTYPIRVNNRGGYSGPYPGSEELTWEDIRKKSQTPEDVDLTELTTTTKLPRRVFSFSEERFDKFLSVCRPTQLCLNFIDYINYNDRFVERFNELSKESHSFIDYIRDLSNRSINYIGTSERTFVDRWGTSRRCLYGRPRL